MFHKRGRAVERRAESTMKTKKLVIYVIPNEHGAKIKVKNKGNVTVMETTAVCSVLINSAMKQCDVSFRLIMEAIMYLIGNSQ